MSSSLEETTRHTLARQWRLVADARESYARRCRAEGDQAEAEEAEAIALDYRIAADNLEAQGSL